MTPSKRNALSNDASLLSNENIIVNNDDPSIKDNNQNRDVLNQENCFSSTQRKPDSAPQYKNSSYMYPSMSFGQKFNSITSSQQLSQASPPITTSTQKLQGNPHQTPPTMQHTKSRPKNQQRLAYSQTHMNMQSNLNQASQYQQPLKNQFSYYPHLQAKANGRGRPVSDARLIQPDMNSLQNGLAGLSLNASNDVDSTGNVGIKDNNMYPMRPSVQPLAGDSGSMHDSPPKYTEVHKYIGDLIISGKRARALVELSRWRDSIPDLAPMLWYSYGVITALLQEIIAIYPHLFPPTLVAAQSNRVCNALALLQCIASHPETRQPFLNAHIPLFLYPFLNTVSTFRPFEYLRLTSLGVIGGLVKVDDPEVISLLLRTEIISLCLRVMETGSELSKTAATFIVQKIVLDELGLRYVCASAERFYALSSVLGGIVVFLTKNPSPRLLKHVVKCYLCLARNARARVGLTKCIPSALGDECILNMAKDDQASWQNLRALFIMLDLQPTQRPQELKYPSELNGSFNANYNNPMQFHSSNVSQQFPPQQQPNQQQPQQQQQQPQQQQQQQQQSQQQQQQPQQQQSQQLQQQQQQQSNRLNSAPVGNGYHNSLLHLRQQLIQEQQTQNSPKFPSPTLAIKNAFDLAHENTSTAQFEQGLQNSLTSGKTDTHTMKAATIPNSFPRQQINDCLDTSEKE